MLESCLNCLRHVKQPPVYLVFVIFVKWAWEKFKCKLFVLSRRLGREE